ncbi:hypothetical protein [Posidoniimonas polymericola]|nr:hypothetical protein [Posidoniimonas polymericola]
MQPKPDYRQWRVAGASTSIWPRFQSQLTGLEGPSGEEVAGVVFDAADAALADYAQNFGLERPASGVARRWFDRFCQPKTPEEIVRWMRRSIRIAAGKRPADAGWALGEAWRQLYPTLVAQFSFGRHGEAAWQSIAKFSREMERLAFGPPIENAAKLVALVDHGVLDLRHCGDHSRLLSEHGHRIVTAAVETKVDRVVDAVLPSGAETCNNEVAGGLLPESIALKTTPGGAMQTSRGGEPLKSDGTRIESVRCFGRVAEGWVIGHDTLNRSLHNQIDTWATGLAMQLTRSNS